MSSYTIIQLLRLYSPFIDINLSLLFGSTLLADNIFLVNFVLRCLFPGILVYFKICQNHYYILCLFAKGQTKNLKVLQKKNKKREGFAKEKKSAKFAMPSASQLMADQSSQIQVEPLIITELLRDSRQTKLCDPLNACPPKRYSILRKVYSYSSHCNLYPIQSIVTNFEINNISQLAFLGASHFASQCVSQTSSQIFTKLPGGGSIASCDVSYFAKQ